MLGNLHAPAWALRFWRSDLARSTGVRFTGIAMVAFAGAYVGLHAFFVDAVNTTVWYPLAGITAAFAARQPVRRHGTGHWGTPRWGTPRWGTARWGRTPLVLGVLVGTAAAGICMSWPTAVWLGYGLANAVEVVVFATVHSRLHRGRRPLERTTDVLRMGLTSVIAVTAGALTFTGPFLLVVVLRDSSAAHLVFPAARGYWASHLTGILVMGPALLAIRRGKLRDTFQLGGRRLEAVLQLLTTAAVSWAMFAPGQHLPVSFLAALPLLWAAARLGMPLTVVAIALGGTVTAALTANGGGPLIFLTDPLIGICATQALLIGNAMAALTLALLAQRRDELTRAVAVSEARYRRTFDHALLGTAVLRISAEGPRLELANPALRRMLGDDGGAAWFDALEEQDRLAALAALQELYQGRIETWQSELRLTTSSGARWFEARLGVLPAEAAQAVGFDIEPEVRLVSAQVIDVTERHLAERRLRELALHDSLTGLPNRTLILDRIQAALQTSHSGARVAVLFCDLDDFKDVNDSAGHASGDAVLIEVARRIRESVRPGDTVGRLGGDEFVVVCPDVHDEEAARGVAQRVLEGVGRPCGREHPEGSEAWSDPHAVLAATSVGLALSGASSTPESLLREADTAMYAAKRGGKNRVAVFDSADHRRALRRVRVERELLGAVREKQFVLHYQPIVDLPAGRTSGVEALVRWSHPERGLLLPAEWLDVAEASQVMPELGAWVLRTAVEQAAAWHRLLGPAAPTVHVNISPAQLRRPGFDAAVAGLIQEHDLPGRLLVLELTEQQLDQPAEAVLRWFEGLRAQGVRLAVDDFGTGYSSLTHLTELPVDVIKLDRHFVHAMHDDPRALAVVQAVLGMGRALGLLTVAEGVETAEQALQLTRLGCTVAQGFLWSRAVPADQLDFGSSLRTRGAMPRQRS